MSIDAAQRFAAGYGHRADEYARVLDPTLEQAAAEVVRHASLTGKEDVLDLATGTGAIARLAAPKAASVIGVDVSPGMIAVAKRLSPPSIRFEVCDASALPFSASSFDVVMCGFGLSHMTDVRLVLEEVWRVLKPGGRFIASSWGTGGRNAAFAAVLDALSQHAGGKLHAFGEILDERTWVDVERGRNLLRDVGFNPVHVSTVSLTGTYANAPEALEWTFAWPDCGATLDALAPESQSVVRAEALAALNALPDLTWQFDINYYIAWKLIL